ncbi:MULTISPECIES: hypothetical protein [Pseudomonas]|uniref:Uncharacterized protein n=1 Tax=Pseudomonas sp. Hg7Tf TaxID=3236988 RepID=A0AB39I9D7_9PSED|nr:MULTISPECIES: hypothetical protein [unclassified Pseudomonas]MDH2558825.1 hypothetical protein [Pseudomonas sp. Hg5Tf]
MIGFARSGLRRSQKTCDTALSEPGFWPERFLSFLPLTQQQIDIEQLNRIAIGRTELLLVLCNLTKQCQCLSKHIGDALRPGRAELTEGGTTLLQQFNTLLRIGHNARRPERRKLSVELSVLFNPRATLVQPLGNGAGIRPQRESPILSCSCRECQGKD